MKPIGIILDIALFAGWIATIWLNYRYQLLCHEWRKIAAIYKEGADRWESVARQLQNAFDSLEQTNKKNEETIQSLIEPPK